jgi:2',3'-cyclic-nucleotide 2'-phosphodiesterase (5'-nucleotidase family)
VGLFCLLTATAQAQQQGSVTPRSSTQPPASSSNAPTAPPGIKVTERAIDESIPNDAAVDAIIAPYSAKVRELGMPIGKLVGVLKKTGIGAGSLGNFVADALRDRAQAKLGKPVLLAITNGGGMRKNEIAEGELTANDIFELLPFENSLITLDLTGEQLRRFLAIVVSHHDAQAGARIMYRTNEKKQDELVSAKLGSADAEKDIDPNAIYTIVTIDYLVKRGGEYSVLQEAKNIKPLNLTMRDAVLDYVKAETAAGRPIKSALDGRFREDKPAGTEKEASQPL